MIAGRVRVTSIDEQEYTLTRNKFMSMCYCASEDQVYVLNIRVEYSCGYRSKIAYDFDGRTDIMQMIIEVILNDV